MRKLLAILVLLALVTHAYAQSFPGIIGPNGQVTWPTDQLFGSGRPWIDVRSGANGCPAALGNNSNADDVAINCQLTYAGGHSIGNVFVPCGNYHLTAGLTVPSGVILVGQGLGCSFLQTTGLDLATIITMNGNYAGMVGIFVLGKDTAAATGTVVHVVSGAVGVQIRDSYIWGGAIALLQNGADTFVQNNFIGAAPAASSASIKSVNGVGKYIGNKIDEIAGTVQYGVLIVSSAGYSTPVVENIFIGNDISGYTVGVRIDDSLANSPVAITSLIGNIMQSVELASHLRTSIVSGELNGNITGANSTTTTVVGVMGNQLLTATGATCAGNLNITC